VTDIVVFSVGRLDWLVEDVGKFVQPPKMMAAALLSGVSQGPANLGKKIEVIS
jgi:hypothetical protein